MRISLLRTLSIGLVLVTVGPGFGQVSAPVFDPNVFEKTGPIQGVSFEPAHAPQDFLHGTLLTLNLADNTSVRGTLVRTDLKNRQFHLRTAPGTVPVAFSFQNIRSAERAFIRTAPSKEGIIAAAAEPPVPFLQPEIVKQTIFNGTQRTVRYIGEALSPGEREILAQLEKAENDLHQAERVEAIRDQILANNLALQEQQLALYRGVSNRVQLENLYRFGAMVPLGYDIAAALGSDVQITRLQVPPVNPVPPPAEVPMTKALENYQRILARTVVENGQVIAVLYEPPTP